MEYILASASPRRQELFKNITNNFTIILKEIEEDYPTNLQSYEVPQYLAEKKSTAYAEELINYPNATLITADTVVSFNGKIIGKPIDIQEARTILQTLSGNIHEVITGVCVTNGQRKKSFVEVSKVYFDVLQESQIEYYLKHFPPLDKAGAYGIQEYIGIVGIQKIEGCFYNIMGLPVNRLANELLNFKQNVYV